MNHKNLNVCELNCLHQLARVIGYDNAVLQLRIVLDHYPEERTINTHCTTFMGSFIWDYTPQKFDYWQRLWVKAYRLMKQGNGLMCEEFKIDGQESYY